jgi:hypothetical protein
MAVQWALCSVGLSVESSLALSLKERESPLKEREHERERVQYTTESPINERERLSVERAETLETLAE